MRCEDAHTPVVVNEQHSMVTRANFGEPLWNLFGTSSGRVGIEGGTFDKSHHLLR